MSRCFVFTASFANHPQRRRQARGANSTFFFFLTDTVPLVNARRSTQGSFLASDARTCHAADARPLAPSPLNLRRLVAFIRRLLPPPLPARCHFVRRPKPPPPPDKPWPPDSVCSEYIIVFTPEKNHHWWRRSDAIRNAGVVCPSSLSLRSRGSLVGR